MKLACLLLGTYMLLPFALLLGSSSNKPGDTANYNDFLQESPLYPTQGSTERKACSVYYKGHEEALANAHNCKDTGQSSACGGPDQCSCASNQRLVQYSCNEGTFNVCEAKFPDGTLRCR
jgi:hypothetical protein